jgi:hypothetical protein
LQQANVKLWLCNWWRILAWKYQENKMNQFTWTDFILFAPRWIKATGLGSLQSLDDQSTFTMWCSAYLEVWYWLYAN